MTGLSIPPLVMASINAYVGIQHLAIYSRVRRSREHLTFGLLALAIAGYCFCAAGLYNAAAPENGRSWQIAEIAFLALAAPALLFFVSDYTGSTRRRFVGAWTAGFGGVALAALIGGTTLVWSHIPAIKHATLPFGLSVTYQEVVAGPLVIALTALALGVYAFGFVGAVGLYRRGERRRAARLGAAVALFFVAFANDILIALGLIHSIYTLEYAFLGFVVLMADGLVSDLARSATIERSLRESEERYRELVELSPDAIAVHCDGNLVLVNSAALRLLGADDPAKLLGRPVLDFVHPDSRPLVVERIGKMLGEGASVPLIAERFLRLDGSAVDVEVAAGPFIFQGRPAVQVVFRDVTERKRAEERLLRSERNYRAVFEDANDAIVVFEPETERILDANAHACELYGFSRAEMLEMSLKQFTKDVTRGEHEIATLLDVGRRRDFETVHRARDGREINLLSNTSIIDYGGSKAVLSIYRDITERKRADEVRAAIYEISEAAQKAARLDDLFAGVHRIVGRLMEARNFYIALYDSTTNLLSFPYFADEVDERPDPFPAEMGMTSYVVRTGQPLLATPEVLRDFEERGEIHPLGAASVDWLGVPLRVQDRVIGVLAVQSYSGSVRYSEADKEVLSYVSTQVAQAIERKRAEARIAQLNRVLRTISEINQLIVRERDRGRLLAEACRILVEHGGFRMAWVGFTDEATGTVVPAASAGFEDGYLGSITVRFDDTPLGRGPTGTAIREGRAVMVDDWNTDECLAPWREAGRRRDYRSSAAFPLSVGGKVTGALSVYLAQTHAFDVESTNLLAELAGDVAFALETMDAAAQKEAAESALREEEERFRGAFDGAATGMAVVGRDGRWLRVNRALCDIVGYAEPDLLTRTFQDLTHPDDLDRDVEHMRKLLAGEIRGYQMEKRYFHKDGHVVWVFLSVSLVRDSAGRPLYFVSHVIDLTERKRLEEQLLQAQKMEAVGRLAGGVAHDFNNILQSMLSHVQLLRAFATDPGRATSVGAELEQQIKRASGLTRQLLVFSRQESARPEQLDLNEVIEQASGMLRPLVREDIAFSLQLAEQSLVLEADRGQLNQVLMNLVVNASDAMSVGGTITMRSGREGDNVWLEVEDTGHGIPAEVLPRIFEPFFTTKAIGQGTGLGLSVVHGIVTAHRGRVDVRSAVGTGTTVRVLFPSAAPSAAPVPSPVDVFADLPRGNGERILLVEDEQTARQALGEMLTMLGYEVTAAASAEEAGLLPVEPAFDLLLTDLILPGAHGGELAQGLRDRWPTLGVIVMSGYTDDEAIRRRVSEGKVRFLQKPFDMSAVAREIRAALSHPS